MRGFEHLVAQAHADAARAGEAVALAEEEGARARASDGSSARSSRDGGDGHHAGGLEEDSLDPAQGLAQARAEFQLAASQADGALLSALRRGAASRESHSRAFAALAPILADRSNSLDARRWRLEAERLHIEALLEELARARWYVKLLMLAADGGRGALSRGEAAVLARVKACVQADMPFDAPRLYELILQLSRAEKEAPDVQRTLLLLREEVGVSPAALRAFLREHALPVPLQLRVGDLGGRSAGARSTCAESGGPRASARVSTAFSQRG